MTASRIPTEVDTSRIAPVHPTTFYEQHFAFTWASLRRLGVAPTDLEDVTHDVFVVAHRRHRELARATSPRGWLFGIVRRVASNYRRGVWRHRRRVAAIRDLDRGPYRPERAIERTDAAHVLARFLEGLAEPQREAFVLFELQQRTAREVAEILQINPNTASARLRAARRAFDEFAARVRLENEFDEALALREARSEDRPPPDAQQRVGSALAVSLGAPTKAIASAWTLGAWAKVAAVTLALGGGTLGAIVGVARAMHAPPAATAPTPTVARRSPARPASSVPPSPKIPQALAVLPEPATIATIATAATTATTATTTTAVPSPPTPPTPSHAELLVEPRTRPSPAPPTRAATDDDVVAQVELLADARAALAKPDPEETLRLASSYRERFGAGSFLTEIDLLEIHAHCATGDVERARDHAARFARSHPRSAHLLVIAKTCAGSITKPSAAGD